MGWFGPSGDCGCCGECTCLGARSLFLADFTQIDFTNGPASIGTMPQIYVADNACGATNGPFPGYAFPGVPDFSQSLTDNVGCSYLARYENCDSRTANNIPAFYQICDDGCTGGASRGIYLAGGVQGVSTDCTFPTVPMHTTNILIEFSCVDGVEKYRLTISQSYALYERKQTSSPACDYAPTSQPADGAGYSWSTIGDPFFGPTYKATRDDGLATIAISNGLGPSNLPLKLIGATTTGDYNTASVDLWTAAYNPLALFSGTVSTS